MRQSRGLLVVIALLGATAPSGTTQAQTPAPARKAYTGVVKPIGPYTPGVGVGDTVYLSGQIGLDPATGQMVEGGTEAQAKRVMENLGAVLKESGLGFGHVVKATIFMTDLAEFAKVNEIYGRTSRPAACRRCDPPCRSRPCRAAPASKSISSRCASRPPWRLQMDMPKPGDAHTRLHRLAGQWGGEETVHPAPHDPGGSATAFLDNRIALDGFTVVQEYEQYRPGRPTYSGHGVFWFDPVASQYVLTWFDSMMGAALEFRGHFDGDVLRLEHTLMGGGLLRATFDCGLPGEYVFVMEVSMDGTSWVPTLEGAYGLLNGPTPAAQKTRARKRAAVKHGAPRPPARRRPVTKATRTKAVASARKATARKATARKATAKTAGARTKPAVKSKAAPKQVSRKTSVTRAAKKSGRAKK